MFANHNVHRNSKDDDGPYNTPPTHTRTHLMPVPTPAAACSPPTALLEATAVLEWVTPDRERRLAGPWF